MKDISHKEAYVKEYQDKIDKASVVVLASCEGVNVADMTALRKAIRETGSEIKVVKNSLVSRALKNLEMEELDNHLKGSTAITFGYDDPIGPVKALVEFADKSKKLSFKAGMLEGRLLDQDAIVALSKMPGRKELLSMLVSCTQGPIRNFVSVCQGPIRKMVYALEAIREKKEKEAA